MSEQMNLLQELEVIEPRIKFAGDEAIPIERIDPSYWVTKSNELIEATYKLTLMQQRILLIIASRVEPEDDSLKLYRFSTKDVIDIMGVSGKDAYYSEIKHIISDLQTKTLTIHREGRETNFSWVITSDYIEKQGYFQVQLHPELRPFFLEMNKKFTKYRLENVLRLSSFYAIRLYELLKQFELLGRRTFSIDELKDLLGIEQDKYQQYGHLKSRVLVPAQKEILSKTDISFVFEELKTGRKITDIAFTIKRTKGDVLDEVAATTTGLTDELLLFGLKKRQVSEFLKVYDEERIARNLAYTREQMERREIDNPAAYLVKAINDDYAAPKEKKAIRTEKEPEKSKKPLENVLGPFDLDLAPDLYESEILESLKAHPMDEEEERAFRHSKVARYIQHRYRKDPISVHQHLFTDPKHQDTAKNIVELMDRISNLKTGNRAEE